MENPAEKAVRGGINQRTLYYSQRLRSGSKQSIDVGFREILAT